MKIIFLTLSFLFLTNLFYSQTKKKDLIGEWYSENQFGQYYKGDTIQFTRTVKNLEKKLCEFIKWDLGKRSFKISEVNICTPRVNETERFAKEKIKIRNTDFGQVIEHYQSKNLIEKFRIVELENNNASELKVMRFDKLTEQKLYKYVDSLIFKVLQYKPELEISENINRILNPDGNSNVDIKVIDGGNGNPEPLIVVNGYPLENREFLKELLLVETYGITYLTAEKSARLYGSRAINGVVILQTSEKRFKAVRKKYGR